MTSRRSIGPLIPLISLGLVAAAGAALGACAFRMRGRVGNRAVPEPAKTVDLNRYCGVWYEIGRYENWFERDCEAATAEYRAEDNGAVQVINTCRAGGLNGPVKVAKGRAKVVAGSGNAKLKVSFFGPFFSGDYWVLDHDPDYAWSIVGEPSGRYLWLLSRVTDPTAETYAVIDARVREFGYDMSLIRRTQH